MIEVINRMRDLLQRESVAQLLKYLVVGGGITAIYLGGVWLGSVFTDLPPLLINSTFYILSAIIGYTLNYYWAFKSDGQHLTTLLKYTIVAGAGIALNAIYVWGGLQVTDVPLVVISFTFAAMWPVVSFFAQKYFVYG